ncbi:MAG TPA: prolyl oligopeptidase family serine peptidase [Candidatus Methylomirabilis sp.]|nr:prolyl oligopeptidase family serine peptidase [Candidatus Methylomirabilis sp.]
MDGPHDGKDKRVEIAIHHWAPRFVSSGVPLTDFQEVTAGISRWEEWCAAWRARGEILEGLGRKALAEGYRLSAGEHLTRAALCYHFGKFMFVHDVEQMKRAHRKVIECRGLALPHLPCPGERVEIPYQGTRLAGILRKPADGDRWPVVVMCVGLDSTKEELDVYETTFLARGMATLSFDGPGQGEAEYDIPIRGDYEVAVTAVVDFIQTRAELEAGRIGIWGVSLGGYYSARAAAFEKRLTACISLSGPYNWVETFDGRNELSREAFRVRSHSRTMEEAREKAKTLSLEGVAKNITCPSFVVAGELDTLTPPHNAKRIASEVSGRCELLIVPGGNHVANNRRYMFQTQAADWMAQQLGVPRR